MLLVAIDNRPGQTNSANSTSPRWALGYPEASVLRLELGLEHNTVVSWPLFLFVWSKNYK